MKSRRTAFARWRSERPFWGAVLIALGGIEEFFSGQLDIGEIHIQLGLEGLQALVIPVILVLLGVLIALMPAHRIFYGVIALVVAVYSLVGVNLGGFIIGMVLASVGGVMVVSWMPKKPRSSGETGEDEQADPDDGAVDDAVDDADADADAVAADAGAPAESADRRGANPWLRRVTPGSAAAAAVTLALGLASPWQPAARAVEPTDVKAGCILLILCTPDPTPTPTPSSSPRPSASSSPTPPSSPAAPPSGDADGSTGGDETAEGDEATEGEGPAEDGGSGTTIIQVPGQDRPSAPEDGEEPVTDPEGPSDLTTGTPLLALGADNDHGVFTLPSANTWGDSLEIKGLKRVGLVTVPLADGTRATTIRIECDELVIDEFQLDTKNRHEVVDLDTGGMTLRGNVVVWLDRVGAQVGGGEGLSLGGDLLALEPLMTLLGQGHLVLGLVGAQADELSYESFEQRAWLQ
ncbi:DUF6114 domain-containing protein [Microbacterium sp. NPDC096154]|uniref:DUF6114 domain-containing protein n=1 Tax=Microbacterium sp. NPDC096154 TaxID=3155549 RepID=UPI00332EF175